MHDSESVRRRLREVSPSDGTTEWISIAYLKMSCWVITLMSCPEDDAAEVAGRDVVDYIRKHALPQATLRYRTTTKFVPRSRISCAFDSFHSVVGAWSWLAQGGEAEEKLSACMMDLARFVVGRAVFLDYD